ncbi:putative MFS family arabinose efflux permease [Breoghania corrubedonensis]|uniref:Putative MFS family arabinose efflux permease n=1 Tax=Breoghania corrubedonensis TaxID=665038 RepID=A0A2T5VFD2_9HYPH|nr:MFS transporter [Breoghania corrubedonensis]PTW62467.1 putative MFS family arabinose efflux permease [Breoghania corrubedonensis]
MTSTSCTAAGPRAVSFWITLLLATSCGLIVANIYYAQPLAGPISVSLGLSDKATGLVVTLSQLGYGAGLLFIVPLGDLIETRKLVLALIGLATLGLLGAAIAPGAATLFAAAALIGLGSVAVQVLVPYAAHMAPDEVRGQVVGNVMSGLMLGIMLARPLASFVAEIGSWHTIFYLSAAIMIVLAALLAFTLPKRRPASRLTYGRLITSMLGLMRSEPVLRRRAIYQGCLFGAFSLFWTASPLYLAGPDFQLGQGAIALFALAGVSGAIAAPIAGRIADRGWSRPASAIAFAVAAIAFLLPHLAETGSTLSLALLVVAAVLVDFGTTASLTLGQREIFALNPEYRSRLNGVFMASFFLMGAAGSAAGGWSFAQGGWWLSSLIGFALPVLALTVWLSEPGLWRRGSGKA